MEELYKDNEVAITSEAKLKYLLTTHKFKDWEICAYCKYHDENLTIKKLKKKKCLCKENIGNTCKHLVKYENHAYWLVRKLKLKEKA